MQNAINTDTIFKPVPQKTASGDKVVSEISLVSAPVQADTNEFEGVFLEDIATASNEVLSEFGTLHSDIIPENHSAPPPLNFVAVPVVVSAEIDLSREQMHPARTVAVSVPVNEIVPVSDVPNVTSTVNPAATEIPVSNASQTGVVPSAEAGIKIPSVSEAVVVSSGQSVSDRSAPPQEGSISNAARQSDGMNRGEEQVIDRPQEHLAAMPGQPPEGRQNAETAMLRPGMVSMTEATPAEHRPASSVVNDLPGQTPLFRNTEPTPVSSGTATVPAAEGQILARSAPATAFSADADPRPDNPQMARNTGDKALNPSDLPEKQISASVPAQSKEGTAVSPAAVSSLRSISETMRSGEQLQFVSSPYRSAEVQSELPTGTARSGLLAPALPRSALVHGFQAEPAVAAPQVLTIDAAVSAGEQFLPDMELPLAGTELPVSQRSTALAAMSPVLQQDNAAQFSRISQQLMDVAMRHSDGPVELMLSPEELGRVKMNFAVQDGGLTVTVAAERSETLALIRRHIDVLLQDFYDIGFSGVNLEFVGRDPAGNSDDFDQDSSDPSDSSVGLSSAAVVEEQAPVRINVMNGVGTGLDLRL